MDRRCPWRGASRARSAVDSAPRDEMISFSPAAGGGWRVGQGPGWGLAHGEERGGGGSVEALGRELGEMRHSWWDSAAPAGGGVGGLQRDGLGEADQQALLLEGWKAWRLAQHRRRTVLTVGSGGRRCFRATRGGARCCGLPWRLAGGRAGVWASACVGGDAACCDAITTTRIFMRRSLAHIAHSRSARRAIGDIHSG